jgi:predicted outer membrane lipoprotein
MWYTQWMLGGNVAHHAFVNAIRGQAMQPHMRIL